MSEDELESEKAPSISLQIHLRWRRI